jgi:DNA-binding transcriptional LysR family regulator
VRSSQIEAVVAVAAAGSFGGAARQLGISQSALSRTVAALEREVGARLLQRPAAPVIPTAAGEAFLAAAPAVLAAVAAAREAVGEGRQLATAVAAPPMRTAQRGWTRRTNAGTDLGGARQQTAQSCPHDAPPPWRNAAGSA